MFPLNKLNFFGSKSKVGHKASLVNISINGLQVLSPEPLKEGATYNINLFAPSLSGTTNIKAKAMWCKIFKKDYTGSYYRVGFKFIKMDKGAENNLKKLESKFYMEDN